MFKLIRSFMSEEVERIASIDFIPDDELGFEIYEIVLKTGDPNRGDLFLGHCKISGNKRRVLMVENISFDKDADIDMASKFLLAKMIIDKAIRTAKLTDKDILHVTSDFHMLPEILLDMGFRLYPSSFINGDDYLGIKNLTEEKETNYGINYLTRIKKDQTSGSEGQETARKNRKMGFVH